MSSTIKQGREYGNATTILQRDIFSKPKILETIRKKAFTDANTAVEIDYPLKDDIYIINSNNKKIRPYSIKAKAICKRETGKLDLTKLSYGDEVGVLHGMGESFSHPISTVVTQRKNERTKITMSISKSKNKKHHRKE